MQKSNSSKAEANWLETRRYESSKRVRNYTCNLTYVFAKVQNKLQRQEGRPYLIIHY